MEHLLFSIYDEKAHAYLPPFTLPRSDMAIRTFSDCINSSDHAFSRHPGDYTLYELGVFDDSTGEITPHNVRVHHGIGQQYKLTQSNNEGPQHGNLQSISDGAPIQPGASSGNSA